MLWLSAILALFAAKAMLRLSGAHLITKLPRTVPREFLKKDDKP